jgi:hypothetical protein
LVMSHMQQDPERGLSAESVGGACRLRRRRIGASSCESAPIWCGIASMDTQRRLWRRYSLSQPNFGTSREASQGGRRSSSWMRWTQSSAVQRLAMRHTWQHGPSLHRSGMASSKCQGRLYSEPQTIQPACQDSSIAGSSLGFMCVDKSQANAESAACKTPAASIAAHPHGMASCIANTDPRVSMRPLHHATLSDPVYYRPLCVLHALIT